jgi:hypothetical protein
MTHFNDLFTHAFVIGESYIPTLKPNGVFINVSAPEWKFPELDPLLFLRYQAAFAGSASG